MATVTFLSGDEMLAGVRSGLAEAAAGRPYVLARLRLHGDLHDAGPMPAAALVEAFLAHLGLRASEARRLVEIDTERALRIAASVLQRDLARDEELVTAAAAADLAARLRDAIEPWALVAFTGFSLPPGDVGTLVGRPFVRVVAGAGAEGGVIFVGEQEIAMVWAVDDDSAARGIEDVRGRPRRS